MKTRFLIIIILISVVTLPLYVADIFAPCIDNSDWPTSPCYPPPNPSFQVLKNDWEKYYEYKGETWMESKKIEMLDAYKNGTLDKWLESGYPQQNQNVYFYYFLNDEIPDSNGKYASQEFANQTPQLQFNKDVKPKIVYVNQEEPSSSSFVIIVASIVVIISVVSFIIWRKRK
jgi:hypothetical protein